MISLSLADIAKAVNGTLLNCDDELRCVNNVSTDTRSIKKGDLFIALSGEKFNAHQFLSLAESANAAAVLVSEKTNCTLPAILVEDTRLALGTLGAYVKKQITGLRTVAITGSNGKTTTKEMLASILNTLCAKENAVLATAGNFNNEIGVPLTLLRLTKKTQFAVLELGANHLGEIAYTSSLVEPDVALINNVMPAHLEGFGSLEGIAKAKGEIWGSLGQTGTAIVNVDANFSADYLAHLKSKKIKTITFSQKSTVANVFASDIRFDDQGKSCFKLSIDAQSIYVSVNLSGQHNISNALAAAAIASALGCGLSTIQKGLENLENVAGRVNTRKINENINLIDDTYNANSASIKAAIDLLKQCKGNNILILGDMAELGEYTNKEHQEIGRYAALNEIDLLLTVGTHSLLTSQAFKQGNGKHALHFENKNVLIEHLKNHLEKQSDSYTKTQPLTPITILVKGSRGAKMEDVVNAIYKRDIL